MSVESIPQQETQEHIANKAETQKTALDIFRNKIWKALSIGSAALILQACSPSREEIDAMQTIAIEDINAHGEALTGRPIIKVKGIVEDLGRDGETKEYNFILKRSTTTRHYILTSGAAAKSSSVGMISEAERNVSGTDLSARLLQAIPPSFQTFEPKHNYEILGQVVPRRQGKETVYVLKIPRSGGTVDLTATQAEKEK